MVLDERLDVPHGVELDERLDEQQYAMVHDELELHVVLDERLDVLLDEPQYVQLGGLQCVLAHDRLQGVHLRHLHTGRDELDTSDGIQWCGNQYDNHGHQNDHHVHERMKDVRCTIHCGVASHGAHGMRVTHDL